MSQKMPYAVVNRGGVLHYYPIIATWTDKYGVPHIKTGNPVTKLPENASLYHLEQDGLTTYDANFPEFGKDATSCPVGSCGGSLKVSPKAGSLLYCDRCGWMVEK